MENEGKSLNEVALETLARGSNESRLPPRDLSYLIGSMSEKDARAMDARIAEQKIIDEDLWR